MFRSSVGAFWIEANIEFNLQHIRLRLQPLLHGLQPSGWRRRARPPSHGDREGGCRGGGAESVPRASGGANEEKTARVQTPVATRMPWLQRAPTASNRARISVTPTPGCRKPQDWRLRPGLKAVPQPPIGPCSSWECSAARSLASQPQDQEPRVVTTADTFNMLRRRRCRQCPTR